MILLNPGPVTLSERVREALLGPDICHREPEYAALQDEARRRLLEVYRLDPAQWAAVLLTGSGTAAVEAMTSSLVPAGGRLLVIDNGVYGARIATMSRAYGISTEVLALEWGQEIPLEAVSSDNVTHVAVVHHETTTGRLNDLAAIGRLGRERGVRLLVDGVSSFGAEELDFTTLDAVAATANKCLHGVPGIAFVLVRRELLAAGKPRTVYLDLARYAQAQDAGDTPFTPAVQPLYALVEALREHADQGGWPARRDRYRALGRQVEIGFERLGLRPLLSSDESSAVLRSWRLPAGVRYATLHDHLKSRGFVIYQGQGRLSADIFRISTMGDVGPADIDRLIEAVRECVAR